MPSLSGPPSTSPSETTLAEREVYVNQTKYLTPDLTFATSPTSPVLSEFSISISDVSDVKAAGPESSTVTWDGPNDPENPKNWSKRRKWAVRGLLSSLPLPTN